MNTKTLTVSQLRLLDGTATE